jgi:tRNA dimethylallyltransferase
VAAPLLVIVGETASGKSKLAMDLALKFNGEIICADAWTVREQADIGTSKPSKIDRAQVRHHLLDIIGPETQFSAAKFKQLADQSIEEIQARGKLPIMAGGSGLYIDSVIYDYSFKSTSQAGLREHLNKLSIGELLEIIKTDKISTKDVDIKNKRRLIRLIETKGEQSKKKSITDGILIIGLKTDRDELKEKMENRLDVMIESGLIDEVKKLEEMYGWESPALSAVGYREWKGYFVGLESLEIVKQKILKNNLELAKKQKTWFKRNKSIQWISTPVKYTVVVDMLTSYLSTV